MKTNKTKKLLSLALGAIMVCGTAVGCTQTLSSDVQFWVSGSREEIDQYVRLVDAFNDGYGKDHGIKVMLSTKDSGGYYSSITTTANSTKNGPDVYLQTDNDFKQNLYGHYYVSIQEYVDNVTDIDISDIRESAISRFRIDLKTNTSKPTDPLQALPLDSQPTALYYNKTMFKSAGIKVISVDEEDLAAWNAGTIADNTGKKKSDYGITVDVPAKGYYRSINPYYFNGQMTKGWQPPVLDELLVFNNRIAMNWDEIEDLAMLFSAETNPKSTGSTVTKYNTQYGYFTEWWFNYGWSVGGDCLQDLTGSGEWNFSLLDPNPNYIVTEGTYTGAYTGTVYQAGQTLDFKDKMNIAQGQLVVADDEGDYHFESKTGAKVGIREAVKNASNLAELPSTLEAFNRYLKLGAKTDATIGKVGEEHTSAGLNISPNPNTFVGINTCENYFWSKKIAMIASTSAYMVTIANNAGKYGFEWDIAPLAVYKKYKDPEQNKDLTVVARGKEAGHSNTIALVLRAMSPRKQDAVTFMMWAASKQGQAVRAKLGFFPNQESLIETLEFKKGSAADNVKAFAEVLATQKQGDWMYMPDHKWVEEWCVPLNSYVRNDMMEYEDWYSPAIIATNEALQGYKKFSRA
jgi:ABC-type glycerol-3-phosphate transport system substrate-binding protein